MSIPEVEADRLEPVEQKPPPRPDCWMVIGVNEYQNWKIPFETGFPSREAAVEAAEKLPYIWTHRRILRIPGEP